MVARVAGLQARDGHRVALVILNNIFAPDELASIPPQVRIFKVARPQHSRNPWHLLRYNLILRHLHPDIVHLHHASLRRLTSPGGKFRRFHPGNAPTVDDNIDSADMMARKLVALYKSA